METKGYYAIVGFFVIVLSAIGIIIGLWLSVGLSTKSYTYYAIYMKEAVAGLSVSAPVKYNGVDMGVVKKISIDPTDPQRVVLIVALDPTTPINTATRAVLNMQGLTGVAYMELSGSDPHAPPLTVQPGQRYPVIASSPSLFSRMDVAIDRLSESVKKITANMGTVFNKKNGQLLQDTLQNIDTASHRLNDTLGSAQITFQQGGGTLQTINDQTLPQMMTLLQDVDGTTLRLNDFIQQLSDNPSMLIRGEAPTPLGPGETDNTAKARN